MYIYRALNDFDEIINPMENGLISKGVIDSVLRDVYITLLHSNGKDFCDLIPNYEDLYCEIRRELGIMMHIPRFIEEANERQKFINDLVNANLLGDEYAKNCILNYFSTKNEHITEGSRIDCPWISFSTSLQKIKEYYANQDRNKIAVVDSNIEKYYDRCENSYLLALDLSSKEKIKDNEYVININYERTKLDSRVVHYSTKVEEVIYYNSVPKEKIVTVLNALEYELLLLNFLDESYYEITESEKSYCRQMFLSSIRKLLENEGDIIKYLVEEYYGKSNSKRTLLLNGKYKAEQLKDANMYVLRKINELEEVKRMIRAR